jgi:hypothetical protein
MTVQWYGTTGYNVLTSNSVNWTWPAEQWLREISYRPGWRFEIRTGSYTSNGASLVWPGTNLLITARVPDSNDPDGPLVLFTHTFPLTSEHLHDRDTFLQAVLVCVMKIEMHEAMEYLRFGGVRVKNPHPEPGLVLYE